MSRIFGDIVQIGYVTREFHAALDHFIGSGIGPWFVAEGRMMRNLDYRGAKVDVEILVGVANSGTLQLEIIQPTNAAASIYTEWLSQHPADLLVQHVSSWPVDFGPAERRVRAAGYGLIMGGMLPAGPFGYFTHPARPEFVFEMSELSPERRFVWETVARAARDWDGTEPIRLWPAMS